MFNSDLVVELFNKYKEVSILISLLISIVVALSGVIPSVFVTGPNIIFFGPIEGFMISLFGEVIGGYITFKMYRKGVNKIEDKIINKNKVIDKLINSEGNMAAFLIFQGRLLPLLPSGIVTLAAAISKVDDIRFIVATFIGKIPSIFLEVIISYQFISINQNFIEVILSIIVLVLIYITIKKSKGN